jgi:hypothetical protein
MGACMWKCRSLPISGTAILASTIAVIGCGGGGATTRRAASPVGSYLAAVTRAADATDRVPGYRYAVTATTAIGAKSVKVSGTGTIDARGSEGSLAFDVKGRRLTELIQKPYVYIQLPRAVKARRAHGRRWLRADLATFSQAYGQGSLEGGGSQDPTQALSYLKSVGSVTRVGEEAVHGVDSTHYHAIVDLARLGSSVPASRRAVAKRGAELLERLTGQKTMPIDVWIGNGRVSRVALSLSLCTPAGQVHESFGIDLYGYGPQPVVTPPPASQVTDIDPQLKLAAAKALATLGCH